MSADTFEATATSLSLNLYGVTNSDGVMESVDYADTYITPMSVPVDGLERLRKAAVSALGPCVELVDPSTPTHILWYPLQGSSVVRLVGLDDGADKPTEHAAHAQEARAGWRTPPEITEGIDTDSLEVIGSAFVEACGYSPGYTSIRQVGDELALVRTVVRVFTNPVEAVRHLIGLSSAEHPDEVDTRWRRIVELQRDEPEAER